MAIKVSDVKSLVNENLVINGADSDNAVVTGIRVCIEPEENAIPGDLVLEAEEVQKQKLTRKGGQELWSYSLWSFKYREPKNPAALSQDALKLINEVKSLVESYPEAVLQEFVAMRKKK